MINPLTQLIEITLNAVRFNSSNISKTIMRSCLSDDHKFDQASVVKHIKCPSTFQLKHLMRLDGGPMDRQESEGKQLEQCFNSRLVHTKADLLRVKAGSSRLPQRAQLKSRSHVGSQSQRVCPRDELCVVLSCLGRERGKSQLFNIILIIIPFVFFPKSLELQSVHIAFHAEAHRNINWLEKLIKQDGKHGANT